MPFDYNFSDVLKQKIKKLDSTLKARLLKKVEEIISSDQKSIQHYKNLKNELKEKKRAHIGHFILLFKVETKNNFILFLDFTHHDDAYKK